jgi:hypothetical protein
MKRLEPYLSFRPADAKHLGYGSFARCMWRHREVLAKHLIVRKLENPENQGHIYEIHLRNAFSAVDSIAGGNGANLAA